MKPIKYNLSSYKCCISFPGRYCGQSKPAPIVSSTNKMVIQFLSDSIINKKGFSATWRAVSGILLSNNVQEMSFSMFEVVYKLFLTEHQ